jgi:biopolymer transport protein ExbB
MFLSTLIQIVTSGATAVSNAVDSSAAAAPLATAIPAPTVDSLTLLELIMKGGIIMIPMALLSAITIYFFIERLLTLKASSKLDANFMHSIKDQIQRGNMDGAKALCLNTPHPSARMIEKGISRIGKPMKEIEESMEAVAKLEINRLEKNLSILSLIGRIAPILGFVGTIFGVIKIFYDISLTDNISIGVISGGLYQKMITSAAGLLIGLTAFVAYFILNAMLDKIINTMEKSAMEFTDILHEPA